MLAGGSLREGLFRIDNPVTGSARYRGENIPLLPIAPVTSASFQLSFDKLEQLPGCRVVW